MIKKSLHILTFILILATLSNAAELAEYRGPDITVRYEEPLGAAAKRMASDYRKTRTEIETKLDLRLRSDPLVVVVRDNISFQEMVRNKLVTAFAVPEKNLIVIDFSMMNKTPFDLQDTFKHELIHLLLHQNIRSSSLPKWLDEGVAQWASGGVADIMRTGEKDLLQQALLTHHLMPLRDIAVTFPDPANSFSLAYEESRSFTEFIVQKYGESKLILIIHDLAGQGDIEEAVSTNIGLGLDVLERQWKKDLKSEYSWIVYVADHLYWLLFLAAALITASGFCVIKRRMKNYHDEEDLDAEKEIEK